MRKQNGCANKPARGTEEGFSLCPRGCMHTASRLALLKTHFSLFYTVIAYSIAGHVRLAGAALRPTNSAAQRAAKRQLQLVSSCPYTIKKYGVAIAQAHFDVYFKDTMEKDSFMVRLKSNRERLTPRGQTQLSYHDLMLAMFDVVEGQATPPTTAADTTSMLRSNGKRNFIFLLACIIYYQAVALASCSIVLSSFS